MENLLKPLRLKFEDPQDIATYGARWWVYDESAITQLRARQMMALEVEIGLPLVDVMAGVRADSAMGNLAASWIAVKLALGDKAPTFDSYNPVTFQITWEPIPAEELEPGKEAPTAGDSLPVVLEPNGSPDIPRSELGRPVDASADTTSPTDTVSLIVMPVSESPIS